jgi:SUN domain-containing protein 1/2
VWDIEQVLKDITPTVQKMNKEMEKQIHKIEQKSEKFEQMEHSYEALKEFLPPAVLVIRKPDNSLEIPDEFWRAIVSKMRAEGLEGPAGSGVSEWNEFLDKNHANILNFMRDEIQKSPAAFAAKIIGQQEFMDVLQEEYIKISHMVDKKVEEAVKRMSKTIAQDVAKSAFLDQVRIESLALTNLLANSEINLRKVNYFSPSLGAQIDPHETSSTLELTWKKPSAMQSFYKNFLARQRRGPLTAIEKWDEAGECWCASKVNPEKGRGLAQLGIFLGREAIPRQITIDHIPKEGTPEIDSAPKRLELWAESDEKGAHVHECSTGGKEAGWICLGTFAYNIHADNHVQTFNLDGVLARPVRKTFVRVTENWGADHTCLYRVRLYGESAAKADME